MSTKNTRSGEKYTGNHTTVVPAAGVVCDIAEACPHVTKITPGYIKMGLRSVSGRQRVKMIQDGAAIKLAVRDNTSQQEVFVYASDMQRAKEAIARGVRDAKMDLSFGKSR